MERLKGRQGHLGLSRIAGTIILPTTPSRISFNVCCLDFGVNAYIPIQKGYTEFV